MKGVLLVKMDVRLAVVALASALEVGFHETKQLYQITCNSLRKRGVQIVDTGIVMCDPQTMLQAKQQLQAQPFDALLVCVGTWSEDHHLMDLLGYYKKPVILHAYPGIETGSLCGVQQIGAVFRDIGITDFDFVFEEAGSDRAAEQIMSRLQVIGLCDMMRHTRFGAIGGRCDGMTETSYDEFALLQTIGARVVLIDETELLRTVQQVDRQQAKAVCDGLKKRFSRVLSTDAQLLESAAYYLAMKALCVRYDLSGLTVKCYTKYMGKVCLAGALLAEEGVVCSCEGDLNNVIMMKILQLLSGTSVNCTDILQPEPQKNTILFAHCGNTGFDLANSEDEVELCPVRIVNQGVCGRFVCRPGFVTAADLVGHGGTLRMSVMTGEAVACGMEFPGTPMKIKMKRPVLDLCRDVTMKGCGHHWMICYGDYTKPLAEFCRRTGLGFIDLDHIS